MKSEHRHQLQTNALAQRLDVLVNQFRPYASTIAGIVVAIVVVMFLWSYWAGSAAGRRDAAWDEFNLSVSGANPNLEQLRLAAQEHPGTDMQQMADVTWADGQVWTASRNYIYNRPVATEALEKAISAYDGVIKSSDDERLVNRAQLGLARVYEMQGELEQAREAYLKLKGGYQKYGELQAERLADPESKETYAWLATARPPAPKAPVGPGTPGRRPEFSEGELALPGTATEAALPEGAPTEGDSFEKLLQGLKLGDEPIGADDRYAPAGTPAAPETPATATDSGSETDKSGSPATDAPTTGPLTTEPPTTDKPAE